MNSLAVNEGPGTESSPVARSSVSDAETEGTGRNRHTSFLVNTTIYPNGVRTTSLVRRRYSEFRLLEQQLILERPGAIIPTVIPSNVAHKETFSDEFIAIRTQQLDRWLARVVTHPELADAPFLKTFLTMKNADDWEVAVKQTGSATPIGSSAHGSNDGEGTTSDATSKANTFVIDAEEEEVEKPKGRFATWISNTKTKLALR